MIKAEKIAEKVVKYFGRE